MIAEREMAATTFWIRLDKASKVLGKVIVKIFELRYCGENFQCLPIKTSEFSSSASS